MRIIIALLLAVSMSTNADCPYYLLVQPNHTVPCEGYFFSKQAEKDIRDEVNASKLKSKQLELKDLQIDKISDDRDMWMREARRQAEARHEGENDLRNGFLYGIGTAALLMLIQSQVGK